MKQLTVNPDMAYLVRSEQSLFFTPVFCRGRIDTEDNNQQ